jgi:hypothetical protein
MPQMTKLEIIEVLFDNHFVKNPEKRAFDDEGFCTYYNQDNRSKCAVGMCLTTNTLSNITKDDFYGNVNDLVDHFGGDLDNRLKPKYQGHDIVFWTRLQNLHDTNYYWTEIGLSSEGEAALSELKKNFA